MKEAILPILEAQYGNTSLYEILPVQSSGQSMFSQQDAVVLVTWNDAGRYDLARALEKWGGLQNVAKVLGLTVIRSRRKPVRKLNDPYADLLGSNKASEEPHASSIHSREGNGEVKGGSRGTEDEKRPLPMKANLPGKSKKWFSMPS